MDKFFHVDRYQVTKSNTNLDIWDPEYGLVKDCIVKLFKDKNGDDVIQMAFCHLRTLGCHSVDFQNIIHNNVHKIYGEMCMGPGIVGERNHNLVDHFKSFGDALQYLHEIWQKFPSIMGIHRHGLYDIPRNFVKTGKKIDSDSRNTLWVLRKKDGSQKTSYAKMRLQQEANYLREELLRHMFYFKSWMLKSSTKLGKRFYSFN